MQCLGVKHSKFNKTSWFGAHLKSYAKTAIMRSSRVGVPQWNHLPDCGKKYLFQLCNLNKDIKVQVEIDNGLIVEGS